MKLIQIKDRGSLLNGDLNTFMQFIVLYDSREIDLSQLF